MVRDPRTVVTAGVGVTGSLDQDHIVQNDKPGKTKVEFRILNTDVIASQAVESVAKLGSVDKVVVTHVPAAGVVVAQLPGPAVVGQGFQNVLRFF